MSSNVSLRISWAEGWGTSRDATHEEVENSYVACRVEPADQKRDRADPEEHFADERTHCASVAEGSLHQL